MAAFHVPPALRSETPTPSPSNHKGLCSRYAPTKRLISAFLPRFGTRVDKGGELTKVDLVEKLMIDLAKRFATRAGGYTRIIKLGQRRGDNAPLVFIELVEGPAADAGEEKPKKGSCQGEDREGCRGSRLISSTQ